MSCFKDVKVAVPLPFPPEVWHSPWECLWIWRASDTEQTWKQWAGYWCTQCSTSFSAEGKTKDPDSKRMRKRKGVMLKVLQELRHHLPPASHPIPKSDRNCFQFRTGSEIPSLASMEQMRRNPSSVILWVMVSLSLFNQEEFTELLPSPHQILGINMNSRGKWLETSQTTLF